MAITDVKSVRGGDPLAESAQFVKGVGPARFELLRKLGLETVGDLLFNLPRRYEDFSDYRRIKDLEPEKVQTVAGEVVEIEGRTTRKGKELLSVVISDHTGVVEGTWFNQTFMARKFRHGQRVAFSGKPEWFRDHWQINNPRVQPLDDGDASTPHGRDARATPAAEGKGMVLPIYALTDGLRIEQMRKIERQVVEAHARAVPELLPQPLLERRKLPGIEEAIRGIHLPHTIREASLARQRLAYEELLILQLALAHKRRDLQLRAKAPPLKNTRLIDERIRKLFPFTLTRDQNRAITEICRDLARDRPMQRLLQADVGAGKTAVAVYALLVAVARGYQAAIMAPTEVLARQHWRTLSHYLAHSQVRKRLLTGGLSEKERQVALGEIRMGNVDLVVGTQALIQEDVEFAKLGLVVIDEQHRFGVLQRARIRKLGEDPHYLIMTATPIPRTVALTVFGDLDVSVIREMPPGRLPVITRRASDKHREKLEAYLVKEIQKGRQLYVVCPLVEEISGMEIGGTGIGGTGVPPVAGTLTAVTGETPVPPSPVPGANPAKKHGRFDWSDVKGAEQTCEHLKNGPFKDLRVGLLHGRMDDRLKDATMQRFRDGELQVLVCTQVIEVGVDVPNATLMVIEHADRFGLSQLHQLRGRISRGPVAGECYLFAESNSPESKERLKLFTSTTDGFALAEADVRIRGIGEFFGTRQHGFGQFRFADIVGDGDILQMAREDAVTLAKEDHGLKRPEHALLRKAVLERYGKSLDLAEIG